MKEEVKELKDDFEEIKEMQKTQELKKIQEDKIVEDNKVEEKEKKCHPLFVTFLIIILMIAFTGMGFFGGVYYYKNSLNKKSAEVEKENKKKGDEVIELDEKKVNSIIEDLNNIEKHFGGYYSSDYPFDVNNLSNQQILETAIYMLNMDMNKRNESYAKELVENKIVSVFGHDIKYNHENYNCSLNHGETKDNTLYLYENDKYIYNSEHPGHGGKAYNRNKSYFQKAYKNETEGTLDIQVKVLYAGSCEICGPSFNLYKNSKDSVEYVGGLYSNAIQHDLVDSDFDNGYNEFKNQLPITTFHFEKDSAGNYGLKTITVG